MNIDKIRQRVNSLDAGIIRLLNLRAQEIKKIGRIKTNSNQSIYVPAREKEIYKRIKSLNHGPLSQEALTAIYREIMSASIALEKPLTIAYLGPKATFTNLAAVKKFGAMVTYSPCDSIGDVFAEVERDSADFGVVPVENSIEGAISHTLDLLVDSDLKICSQIHLDIAHNLLARCSQSAIRRVYSNPQVFGQCRQWIESHLPKVDLIDVSSTTFAALLAAKEKNTACIASLLAATEYKLNVLAKDIEDSPHNITRFLVIGKYDSTPTGEDKTSILFSIKDKVGALHDMLLPFKKYALNLTKIESRPSKKRAWDYYFFVDFLGHVQEPKSKRALAELEEKCKFLKILGSYPLSE